MHTVDKEKQVHTYAVLGILLVLTVLIRIPLLAEPWGADQAGFGHVANGMLEGKIPYRDMYSLTAYGVFFTYALFFKLFGTTMVSIHIGHLMVSVVTVVLVFFLTRRLYGSKTAILATLCYTVFSNGLAFSGFGYENKSAWGTYWYLAQREVFMAPLIMGAVFLMVVKENVAYAHLVNGILIGLAAFYKLTAVLVLLLFAAFIVYDELSKTGRFNIIRTVRNELLLLCGFIVIQLPFIYYFWINDALGDVYQALFVHLATYAKLSRGLRIETLFSGHYSVLRENLILWLFAAVSSLYIIFKDRNRNNVLIAAWTLCSVLMIWGQGKFFGYHFILIVPPFAVMTGYGLMKFLGGGKDLREFFALNLGDIKRIFMLAMIIVSVAGFCVGNYDYYKRHARYYLGMISKEQYYKVFNEFPTHPYSFPADYEVVQHLKKKAVSDNKLAVVFSAGDTVVHFLAGLEPATRFIQSWYLFPSSEELSKDVTTLALRKEFIDQIINTFPRFVLVVHMPFEELVSLPHVKDDPSVKRLEEFLMNNYMLDEFPNNRFLFTRMESS